MRTPIADIAPEIAQLFRDAKASRDAKDFAAGIATLDSSVRILIDAGWQGINEQSEDAMAAARLFAEGYGMMGGQWRRLGRHDKALESYRLGRVYELNGGADSSYNSVNAIVSALACGASVDLLKGDIADAIRMLERQTRGIRARDVWAWSDLARCRMLAGRQADAETAYGRLVALWTPGAMDTDPVQSELETLESLAMRLETSGSPLAATIRKGAGFLTSQAKIKQAPKR